jgi:hypothetical protein
MNRFFDAIPHQIKGIVIMVIGILLLLNSLGIIEKGLNALVIAAAILLILYGFVVSGFYQKMFEKNKHNQR